MSLNDQRYRYLLDSERRCRLSLCQKEDLERSPGLKRLVLEGKSDPTGLLQPMDWDSQMLGRICYRLVMVDDAPAVDALAFKIAVDGELQKGSCEYIFCRVEASDFQATSLLQTAGFEVLESLVSFAVKPFRTQDMREAKVLGPRDEIDVLEITEAFVEGRYLVDPTIPRNIGTQVYKQWAKNALERKVGDVVLGIHQSGQLAGYVTIAVDQRLEAHLGVRFATIGLIAVRVSSQRRGVGSALVDAALCWAFEHGCSHLLVGTQTSNIASQRLYVGKGMMPISCETSLRRSAQSNGDSPFHER